MTRSRHWWGRFFGDYGHVQAIIRSEGLWVGIFPSSDVTGVIVYDNWRDAVPEGAKTLKFRVLGKLKRYRVPHIFMPFTCVEQVKALLGISDPRIITPRQLYRRVKNG